MGEDKTKGAGSVSTNIEEILRERERLERMLHEKFKKEVTILFSDICGFTKHMDTRGDISGRALLQRHNDIVLPVIEEHQGTLIKTIGDAVMASFKTPLDAVKASADIQNGLDEHNRKTEVADRIQVKVGINTGEALVDEADVYGDVVNVASRIQCEAGPDQILVSKAVYEQVGGSEDILCRWHGSVEVKGKAQPLELYRVIWRDEDIVSDIEPTVRAYEAVAEKKAKLALKVLMLEVAREKDRLKISVHEHMAGEASTIRHYEEVPVSMDWIETRCREIVETLNNANRQGRLSREVLVKLREVGQVFYDELFTLNVKQKLKETGAEYLSLNLDDQLVHVPWELLHDGQQFLCQRFNMGRLVKTRQTVLGARSRVLAWPLKMLILADPMGDLKGAYAEGTQIRDYMDQVKGMINVSLRSDNITPHFIKEKIRNFDLVHFAGHAEYDAQHPGQSGWCLTDGNLKAQDITKMAGAAAMPALIFSNACQSARTEGWAIKEGFQDEIFGLGNAFLLAGVKHYVGTFWEILDEPSSRFAMEFYKHLLSGMTTGEAIRKARLALIKKYGEETIVWASYLLYGDPTSNYMEQIRPAVTEKEPEALRVTTPGAEVRAREEVIDFAEKEVPGKKRAWWAVAAGMILLMATVLWGYPGLLREGTEKYERAALVYYNEGNFEEALNACNVLEDKAPQVRLTHLIRGNIFLREGKLDAAEGAYERALEATKGTELEKSNALVGLGRIASLRKQPDRAIKYYQQATEVAPGSRLGYLSQALVLEDRGNYDEALSLLGQAQKFGPKDQVLAAITDETRKKVALARDQEKQERIDRLVKDLLETMKSPPGALPFDGWTSPPLTLWLMEFKTQGYSFQEGEDRLLASGITDQLIQHSRVQVVERALLAKLLEELKLGTSKLIDRSTALSLGKILTARLIVSGHIVYSGPRTEVSMRLIETETGRIAAAVNESFGSAIPVSVLSEKLAKNLIEKLKKRYPLRGKISEVKGEEITINIGQKVGARMGQRFKTVDENFVLEIISVQPDTSLAKITKGEGPLQKGLRVEAT
ncbi:MAG: CHAT domain-containing protein [Desulfobacterales bacterium]|nr:CHAT domain-containing protein [Desulfobacterales bacterium]